MQNVREFTDESCGKFVGGSNNSLTVSDSCWAAGPFAVSCPRAMEDVPVNPVNPVNQVSGSRETRCKTFMKQMAGDVFGEAFLDLYWPVNLLHCAIYICFGVSLSYSFLWFSRFAQAQCGKYRIFGGSTANCTFEVVGFLVYVWMTCLSVKLGTPPLEKVLPFNFQSITQNLFACFFGNFLGNALKKGLFFHGE